MPKPNSNYVLKGGAYLSSPGSNLFYANPLPNDEIPEGYLAKYPDNINRFASYPADWRERVERRKAGLTSEPKDNKDEEIAALHERISTLVDENQRLAAENAELKTVSQAPASDDVETLRLENESLRAELDTAKSELAELRAAANKAEAQSPATEDTATEDEAPKTRSSRKANQ